MSKLIKWVGICLLLTGAAYAAYHYGLFNSFSFSRGTTPKSDIADDLGSLPTQGKTDYSDTDFHFHLAYPSDLELQTYDEDEGGRTVTFEGATPGLGFQIFVVPYSGTSISAERFKKDDPSGVMKEPQDIVIDGAPAKIFFGHNDQMGDTREVWFIHGGYLYEITTYKALDSWIADIMQSWKFI